MTNVLDIGTFEIITGTKKGDIAIKSAWNKSSGTDAQIFMNLQWDLTPTADYVFGKSRLQIFSAASLYADDFEVSQFRSILNSAGTASK
jgi:hypothetical protein